MSRDNTLSDSRNLQPSLSLSYYTVPELSALETVLVAGECGFEFVGLRLLGGQPGHSEMPLMQDVALRRRVKRAMRESGIAALDANTVRLQPASRARDYFPMLDVAAELGARHVLVTCDDADSGRLVDNLCSLADIAASRKLTLDIEFVPWLAIPDLDAAANLVERCAHPVLGIAVDALHFERSGSSLESIRKLPERWFRYFQLCDAPRPRSLPTREELIQEAIHERLAPGAGVIDLAGLIEALPSGVPMALEIPQSTVALTVGARERAANLVRATRRLLDRLATTT